MEREITAFARPFEEAKDIIKSTLDLKERRPSIDGKAIVKKFPSEYIERYQNLHAVLPNTIPSVSITTV